MITNSSSITVLKNLLLKLKRLSRVRSWGELRRMFGLVFYKLEAVRRELQLAAIGMIGETTLVFIRPPIYEHAGGNAYRNSNGVRIIDLHPYQASLGLDALYGTFLHEVCHQIWHLDDTKRPPEIDRKQNKEGKAFVEWSAQDRAKHDSDPDEMQANSFVTQIDRIAKDRALYKFGNDEIRTRIRVLQSINFMNKEN